MIIELSDAKPAKYGYKKDMNQIINSTYDTKYRPQRKWEGMQAVEIDPETLETTIRHSIKPDADEYHLNYMQYLTSAWGQHNSIVLNPDIVWFAILNEIAKEVVSKPEPYRSLFTRSPDKVCITVPVGSPDDPLPVNLIANELKTLVPIDIGLFIPMFSTTDDAARITHLASFAETVSPFYSYMTLACNFPKIRVDGTLEDYDQMLNSAMAISNEMDRINAPITPWMHDTALPWLSNLSEAVHNADADFFIKILSAERCGSGGEIAVDGWWSRIFANQPKGQRKPENFPTQIARVPWTNADTGREFTLNCGVFHSVKSDDDFMEPKFGWVQNELVKQ